MAIEAQARIVGKSQISVPVASTDISLPACSTARHGMSGRKRRTTIRRQFHHAVLYILYSQTFCIVNQLRQGRWTADCEFEDWLRSSSQKASLSYRESAGRQTVNTVDDSRLIGRHCSERSWIRDSRLAFFLCEQQRLNLKSKSFNLRRSREGDLTHSTNHHLQPHRLGLDDPLAA